MLPRAEKAPTEVTITAPAVKPTEVLHIEAGKLGKLVFKPFTTLY